MVYNTRMVNEHMYLRYMQIHCEYISVMHSYCRVFRTIYKISVMRYFLLINCLLVLEVCLEMEESVLPSSLRFHF